MGVVAKDVVSAWQQVVCLDELVNRMRKRHGGYYHTKQNITTVFVKQFNRSENLHKIKPIQLCSYDNIKLFLLLVSRS